MKLGTSVLTIRMAARLRRKHGAFDAQRAAFAGLVRRLAATSHWRTAGIEPGLSYEEFRTRVAPPAHEQLTPAIERMQRGEADVLWPGGCHFFAATSGTTTGKAKLLPVTAHMLAHFRRATRDAVLYYTSRVGHAGVFAGRHLFLGGATGLTAIAAVKPAEAYAAELGGIISLGLPAEADQHLLEPGTTISQMTEGLAKFDAIAARTTRTDISLIAGLPNWVLGFANALRETSKSGPARPADRPVFWPNLECLIHAGVPIGPFRRELRAALGPKVKFHEVYPACEGFIAAQDAEPEAGLRLMADTGIFFEFLPLADFDETRLGQLGAKAVPLAEVKGGVDYVPLVTTPAGLARYCLGDIVRFTSTEPPRLVYVGRTTLRLATFGERVVERELTDALVAVCHRHNWSLVNFHVAPRLVADRTRQNHGTHEWWIELRPGLNETPTGPNLAVELDSELQRFSPEYAARRKAGAIGAPVVRLVMPGVFEHWLRYRGQWGGQNKMPRCRSDRLVADELAQMTNFAQE